MTPSLLPHDLDALLERAVATFWATRAQGTPLQGGARGQVLSGKNLDGFLEAARAVATHCGVPDTSIFTSGRGALTLPGYYRPTKEWDVLIVHDQRLLAALEFKSQVGSFGNNFNNRAEEVIGSASDLWAAAHHRLYSAPTPTQTPPYRSEDPRPPFLGYLMLLEDSEASAQPVALSSPHDPPPPHPGRQHRHRPPRRLQPLPHPLRLPIRAPHPLGGPHTYIRLSPFFHAHKIQAPLLLIHGELDNTPGTLTLQSKRLFHLLKGLDNRARLVTELNYRSFSQTQGSVPHVSTECFRSMTYRQQHRESNK